jgi:hypothetical protein
MNCGIEGGAGGVQKSPHPDVAARVGDETHRRRAEITTPARRGHRM